MTLTQVFPLDHGGAAADRMAMTGDHGGLRISDRTAWPRLGIKGPGSADWMRGAGISLPQQNHLMVQPGLTLLRLGQNDIVILSDDGATEAVADLRQRWEVATAPKGYSSWREEAWAWLHLSGPSLDQTLARCCAVDLRLSVHKADRIAQTAFAHVDAVVIRQGDSVDILFDMSATAAVLATLRHDGGHS